MEWVEVTAKSVDSAKELALDQLGISADDAEFEVVEEPRSGLFGRVRGEARVRARVKPTVVRPKQERRARRRTEPGHRAPSTESADTGANESVGAVAATGGSGTTSGAPSTHRRRRRSRGGPGEGAAGKIDDAGGGAPEQGGRMDNAQNGVVSPVAVDDVRVAAEQFAGGLVTAFGMEGSTSARVEGNEIDVRIDAAGDGLGLLIGPSGRTLLAIQDLARVAAQRRLGDHDTRLRIDVAGYREKRRAALERFAGEVAALVIESGVARSLEPMPSSDRKVVHDTLTAIDGVVSRSEGEDPFRRIIVSPA